MRKEELLNNIYKYLKENENYLWLKLKIEEAQSKTAKDITLVTGSSHALNGIDIYCFSNAVNCSMHSQDLYYDYLCAKKILSVDYNKSISKCFIILGYYIGFQDLSRAVSVGRQMIKKVYYPLLGDARHWENPEIYDFWEKLPLCDENEKKEIERAAINMMKQRRQYYSDIKMRIPYFDFGKRKWRQLEEAEKDSYGKQRAEEHNHLLKYCETLEENKEILRKYVELLEQNDIKPIMVVAPYTKAYNKYVDSKMKSLFLQMVSDVRTAGKLEFLDFNDTDYFDDGDFIDADHLNGRGAYKMSTLLAQMYGE